MWQVCNTSSVGPASHRLLTDVTMSLRNLNGNDVALRRTAALDAYHRGDANAGDMLRAALAEQPLDGGLLIADATLSQEAGAPGALDRLERMLMQAPDWLDGHVALAHLRWGAGRRDDFLAVVEAALCTLPRHAGLWMRYMSLLADSGQAIRAADVAEKLRRSDGDVAALRLIEAQYAGAGGAQDRAGKLLATVPDEFQGRALAEARHRLRIGDALGAVPLLDRARAEAGDGCAAWALSEIAWRAIGDPRHHWLIDATSMVRAVQLVISAAELAQLAADLRGLHARRWPALGQSGRGATQTRGNLRHRRMPSVAHLFEQCDAEVAAYMAMLPAADPGHPLLRHRDTPVAIDAAWSIRMPAGGHHVGHIHPGGAVSSACHVIGAEPSAATDRHGWLELGRPPADIAIALEPLAAFAPAPGQIVLFPSYIYHNTVAYAAGERLSVAFDVA